MKRKMSIGNFDFGLKQGQEREKQQSPRSPKPHKYSCQYEGSSDLPSASYAPSVSSDMFSEFDYSDEPVMGHSKSIRIEL